MNTINVDLIAFNSTNLDEWQRSTNGGIVNIDGVAIPCKPEHYAIEEALTSSYLTHPEFAGDPRFASGDWLPTTDDLYAEY